MNNSDQFSAISDKLNTIICDDNVTVLSDFPDACIDLTVTSPPYDNLRLYNGFIWDFEALARQLYRATKPGGVVVWVVGDAVINGSETGASFRQALGFIQIGFRLHDTMIYEKNGMTANPDKNRYYQKFEFMFIFSKGLLVTFNPIEDRENKWPGSFGRKHFRGKDGELVKAEKIVCRPVGRRFNIWKYNTGAGYTTKDKYAFEHPAIFPEELARDHILSWSNPGDIVLDPFIGSGTTAKMAKETGRNFIGIDISAEYCKLAEKRIRGAKVPLFV
jgi:DNA modification methylase